MKKQLTILLIMIGVIISSCSKNAEELTQQSTNEPSGHRLKSLPANPNNKVAYYAFDATPSGQGKLRAIDFTDKANIVVMFEGTVWEVADSAHYGSSSSYILTINGGPYKYYKQIINDMKALQARGIKVLWNVDDKDSWNTATPFTTYDNNSLNATQFASFVNNCITTLGLDGIALDIEHLSSSPNSNWVAVIQALGAYFGPKSSNPNNTIYTAAIYDGGKGGSTIGQNTTNAAYFNFVMDMGYFENNTSRFNQWANSIGAGKVMDGFSHEQNSLDDAIAHVNWMKTQGGAGVMVFAGNVSKSYTDAIFDAIGSGGCDPTTITPYTQINGGSWSQTASATVDAGSSVKFGPQPDTGGSWSWTGPNSFSATTREITISNVQSNQAGSYVATYTNDCGAKSSATFSITINGGSNPQVQVSLSSSFNVSYGIVTNGSTFGSTSGLDGQGYGYSSTLLGSSVTWNSTTFSLGAANTSDAVSGTGQTITLTSGKYTYLRILATGVGGNRTSQSFRVNYSDGTYSNFTQSISDWCTPQNYSGESKAVTMSYRNRYNGTQQNLTCNLYGYTFNLTSSKTVSSIKLPNNSKVRVLAITLVP